MQYQEGEKKKKKFNLTLHDFYKNSDLKDKIDKQLYIDINKVFFIFLSRAMIETGRIFKLPRQLGSVYVGKRKSGKKKVLDYPHYRRTGELLFRRMTQDDQFIAFFEWDKKGKAYSFKMKNTLKFTPVRSNKKELSNAIKTKNTMSLYKTHGIA